MNWRPFPAPLRSGVLLLACAATAAAVPKTARPNNQALLQQHAKTAQQHLLQQAAAGRQHQLLTIHARTFQQHLLQQAHRPERPAGERDDDRAPVTRIRRD